MNQIFARHGVRLTVGGEPTYVPVDPVGHEWSITALGPTKLNYARALARMLVARKVPHAIAIHSPGKMYPGELNPRWVLCLVWRTDGGSESSTKRLGQMIASAKAASSVLRASLSAGSRVAPRVGSQAG